MDHGLHLHRNKALGHLEPPATLCSDFERDAA
jgi:hypothetical protein